MVAACGGEVVRWSLRFCSCCSLAPTVLPRSSPPFSPSFSQTPSMVVPLREGADRPTANSLALRLSRLSLSQLLHNQGGVVVRERLVKGDSVRPITSSGVLHTQCLEYAPRRCLVCLCAGCLFWRVALSSIFLSERLFITTKSPCMKRPTYHLVI